MMDLEILPDKEVMQVKCTIPVDFRSLVKILIKARPLMLNWGIFMDSYNTRAVADDFADLKRKIGEFDPEACVNDYALATTLVNGFSIQVFDHLAGETHQLSLVSLQHGLMMYWNQSDSPQFIEYMDHADADEVIQYAIFSDVYYNNQ